MTPPSAGLQHRLLFTVLAGGLPAWLVMAVLVWQAPWLIYPKIVVLAATGGALAASVLAVRRQAAQPLRTIASLIAAVRVGDYSMLMRGRAIDSLGALADEINQLAGSLHTQRLKSEEALRLVDNVVDGIDIALFAFDAQGRLELVNRAACHLLRRSAADMLGRTMHEAGLAELFAADTQQVFEWVFPGGAGLWKLHRQGYQVEGKQHTLLFVNDLKQVLRGEELKAWRQLIRVLSHEVNNSLGPIGSVSATLRKLTQGEAWSDGAREDIQDGLDIIEARAQRLGEFVRRYAALTHLPEPHKVVFDLGELLRRLAGLQAAGSVVLDGPDEPLHFYGDPAQIEQLIINLVKNGIEADGAPLTLRWQRDPMQIAILDCGRGIQNAGNLFVPFYTTKPGGSGIGLVLCRQIAEAHHGALTLHNREDRQGCMAVIRFAEPTLPLDGVGDKIRV